MSSDLDQGKYTKKLGKSEKWNLVIQSIEIRKLIRGYHTQLYVDLFKIYTKCEILNPSCIQFYSNIWF